jgi:hypothetical protein
MYIWRELQGWEDFRVETTIQAGLCEEPNYNFPTEILITLQKERSKIYDYDVFEMGQQNLQPKDITPILISATKLYGTKHPSYIPVPWEQYFKNIFNKWKQIIFLDVPKDPAGKDNILKYKQPDNLHLSS